MTKLQEFEQLQPPSYATIRDSKNGMELARLLHVMWNDKHGAHRPPLVIIEGAPMSGKTHWLNQLCKLFELPQHHLACFPYRDQAIKGKCVVVIEDVGRRLKKDEWQRLDEFLVAEEWGRSKHPLSCMTVIHSHGDLEVPEPINRQVLRIRLTKPEFVDHKAAA